jgi:pyruvate ferredoxin oxidoreductase alpha subunit
MTADLADGKDVPEVTWVSYPKANTDKGEK